MHIWPAGRCPLEPTWYTILQYRIGYKRIINELRGPFRHTDNLYGHVTLWYKVGVTVIIVAEHVDDVHHELQHFSLKTLPLLQRCAIWAELYNRFIITGMITIIIFQNFLQHETGKHSTQSLWFYLFFKVQYSNSIMSAIALPHSFGNQANSGTFWRSHSFAGSTCKECIQNMDWYLWVIYIRYLFTCYQLFVYLPPPVSPKDVCCCCQTHWEDCPSAEYG